MTPILTWITPFGVPFDTAVLFGILLAVLALVLGQRADRDPRDSTGDRGQDDQEVDR